MDSLKKLREELGLSQAQFAGVLGVSNGLIALAETDRRTLPEFSKQIFWKLQKLATHLQPVEKPYAPISDLNQKKIIADHIRKKNLILFKKQTEIESKQEKLDKLVKLIALGKMMESETLWPEGYIEKDEWDLLLRKNSKKISKLSSTIILLKINISGLEAEIKTAQEEQNN